MVWASGPEGKVRREKMERKRRKEKREKEKKKEVKNYYLITNWIVKLL